MELNLGSNTNTKETKGESIWRKQDIETLRAKATELRYELPPIQWGAGHGKHDRVPDNCKNGYKDHDHIKLECEGVVKTSMAMILQKPAVSGGNVVRRNQELAAGTVTASFGNE